MHGDSGVFASHVFTAGCSPAKFGRRPGLSVVADAGAAPHTCRSCSGRVAKCARHMPAGEQAHRSSSRLGRVGLVPKKVLAVAGQ